MVNDVYVSLTRKERGIVAALLDGEGRPVTREDIVKKVWKYTEKDNLRVVDIHIRTIRSKFSKKELYDYIDTISGVGYRWRYEE